MQNRGVLLQAVEYARPTSVDDAIGLLSANDGARALAGGQTLLNVMKARVASPDVLVDMNGIEELRGIRADTVVSRTNARGLYWTMPQQLAHATVNGASLRTGDLFASGTISGSTPGSEGSLIELTRNGAEPLRLEGGGERTFLEDGDEVVLRGQAGDVELAEVRGRVVPAR